MRDPLTGLGDRDAFHEALRAARVHETIAVVLVDVEAPDEGRGRHRLLLAAAAALSGVLRRGDELFLLEGGGFAALIGVSGARDARAAGRRLKAAATRGATMSVSVGVALPGEHDSDAS